MYLLFSSPPSSTTNHTSTTATTTVAAASSSNNNAFFYNTFPPPLLLLQAEEEKHDAVPEQLPQPQPPEQTEPPPPPLLLTEAQEVFVHHRRHNRSRRRRNKKKKSSKKKNKKEQKTSSKAQKKTSSSSQRQPQLSATHSFSLVLTSLQKALSLSSKTESVKRKPCQSIETSWSEEPSQEVPSTIPLPNKKSSTTMSSGTRTSSGWRRRKNRVLLREIVAQKRQERMRKQKVKAEIAALEKESANAARAFHKASAVEVAATGVPVVVDVAVEATITDGVVVPAAPPLPPKQNKNSITANNNTGGSNWVCSTNKSRRKVVQALREQRRRRRKWNLIQQKYKDKHQSGSTSNRALLSKRGRAGGAEDSAGTSTSSSSATSPSELSDIDEKVRRILKKLLVAEEPDKVRDLLVRFQDLLKLSSSCSTTTVAERKTCVRSECTYTDYGTTTNGDGDITTTCYDNNDDGGRTRRSYATKSCLHGRRVPLVLFFIMNKFKTDVSVQEVCLTTYSRIIENKKNVPSEDMRKFIKWGKVLEVCLDTMQRYSNAKESSPPSSSSRLFSKLAMHRNTNSRNPAARLLERGCILLGNLAILTDDDDECNSVSIREKILKHGGLQSILMAMKSFPYDATLQQEGCYSISLLVAIPSPSTTTPSISRPDSDKYKSDMVAIDKFIIDHEGVGFIVKTMYTNIKHRGAQIYGCRLLYNLAVNCTSAGSSNENADNDHEHTHPSQNKRIKLIIKAGAMRAIADAYAYAVHHKDEILLEEATDANYVLCPPVNE